MGSLGLTMKLLILVSFIPAGLALRPDHARTFDLLSVAFNGVCSTGGRCPGSDRGVITSPNYPLDYPVKQDINYTIETYQGSVIELTFEAFDLEDSRKTGRGGCYDSVRIIDSDNEILGTYCEKTTIKPFNSTSNTLVIIFSSDEEITRSGFKASWRRIEMTEKTGKITSTNYPNLQTEGDSIERVGVLNGPKGSRFELTFTDLDLDDEYCGRFYHTIYLFDGLPNSNSLYNAQFIAVIYGGNLITNQDKLKHISKTNVVSVWMFIYDYGDYDY